MTMQPRADILLATHNGEAYLRAQLDSILAQDDGRWRLIASDDASTDGTCKILDEYAARYPEKIIHHRSGRTFGHARDHFLYLMLQSDAPWILFCDQDDVWRSDKVRLTLQALEQAGDEPVLVFTDLRPVDAQLQEIAPSLAAYQHRPMHDLHWRSLLLQNVVNGCTMGCSRALAHLAALCPDNALLPMHDGWMAAVAACFGQLIYIDQPTVDYRQHAGNSVGGLDVQSAGYIMRRLTALKQLRLAIEGKKQQARAFRQAYASHLQADDLAFLDAFIRPHSGPWFYWRHRRHIHSLYHLAGFMLLG